MMERKLVREDLENMPSAIKVSEEKIMELSSEILDEEMKIHSMSETYLAAVLGETITVGDKEKNKFPNQALREIEINKRLSSNPEFSRVKSLLSTLKEDLAKEKIKLNFLQNKFSSSKYLTHLFEKEGE